METDDKEHYGAGSIGPGGTLVWNLATSPLSLHLGALYLFPEVHPVPSYLSTVLQSTSIYDGIMMIFW